jgi:hypothetical protein
MISYIPLGIFYPNGAYRDEKTLAGKRSQYIYGSGFWRPMFDFRQAQETFLFSITPRPTLERIQ